MSGISIKLPLQIGASNGLYELNEDARQAIKQNFKNLILTQPGERVMDPIFGIGIKSYLFEQSTPFLFDEIKAKIHNQVNIYLPFIQIIDIKFISEVTPGLQGQIDPHELAIKIVYRIPPMSETEFLDITIE